MSFQKSQGGRPRKYATQEEAKRADLEKRRIRRFRQQAGPADFIPYEPELSTARPTPPNIGLRVGPEIPIPTEPGVITDHDDEDPEPESPSINDQADTVLPSVEFMEDEVVIQQLQGLRMEELADTVNIEYDAEILDQLKETEAGSVQSEREDPEGILKSISSPINKPSVSRSQTYTLRDTQSPARFSSNRGTSSEGASEKRRPGRPGPKFPAQINTLSSWITPRRQIPIISLQTAPSPQGIPSRPDSARDMNTPHRSPTITHQAGSSGKIRFIPISELNTHQ